VAKEVVEDLADRDIYIYIYIYICIYIYTDIHIYICRERDTYLQYSFFTTNSAEGARGCCAGE